MITKKTIKKKETKGTDEDVKRLVLARIELMPSDVSISIGSDGEFSKKEMVKHIQENTAIGKKIAEIHLGYLQSLKDGIFYEQETV